MGRVREQVMEKISTYRKAWIWEMVVSRQNRNFYYLVDMLSGGRGANLASVVRVCCA